MNFGEIQRRVGFEMAHYPQVLGHRDDNRGVINRVNKRFLNAYEWPFMLRKAPIYSFPDLTIPNANVSKSAGRGDRSLLLPDMDTIPTPPMYDPELTSEFAFWDAQLTGAEMDLVTHPATGNSANWDDGPFTIEMVIELGAGPGPVVQLDPRATFTALSANDGPYIIRFPRILLPADVQQVSAVRTPEGRELFALTPSEQRRVILEPNHTSGSPRWMLEDQGHQPTRPVWVDPFFAGQVSGHSATPFIYQRETWPLRETVSISFTTPGGAEIPASTRIRVFCCWFWSGRFGPPSNIAESTTASAGGPFAVAVTGYPQLPTSGAFIEYGRRVAIFMAEGEGAFFLRGFVMAPATPTTTITTRNFTSSTPGLRFPRWDEVYPDGPYQYMRIWPRPTAMTRLEVEYWARPRELIEDTDSPEFPDNHDVLVWLTVAELLASPRYNNPQAAAGAMAMAKTYERPLIMRAFPKGQYKVRRGQVDRRLRDGVVIPPDLDYLG